MTILERRNYVNVHYWLSKNHGKAFGCTHCERTDNVKYEWALLKGKSYERNIENFIPLCKSCHRKYDQTPESIEKQRSKMIGRKTSQETKDKMSKARKDIAIFPSGWKLSELTKNKISESKKGKPIGVGKILSKEHRQAISNGHKKRKLINGSNV